MSSHASPETPDEAESARRERLDALLDDALEGTFPASDPIALDMEDADPTSPSPEATNRQESTLE